MTRTSLAAVLVAAAWAAHAAPTYTFKTLDIDPQAETILLDIGRTNTILALNLPASGVAACTLIQRRQQTVLVDPAGVATHCYGLNTAGTVVGYYEDLSNIAVGFVYSQGTFTDFVPPSGMTGLLPISISDSGLIAGYYYDAAGPHGFVLDGTDLSTFQITGMTNVFPGGINNRGQMTIQAYDTSGAVRAFLKKGANLTELIYPGAAATIVERINNRGQVVGSYVDSSNVTHGFLYDESTATYETIDFPGAASSALDGINDAQTLVGSYRATPGAPRQGLEATLSAP